MMARWLPEWRQFSERTDLRAEVLEDERVAVVDAIVAQGGLVVVEDLFVGGRDALAVYVDLDRVVSVSAVHPSLGRVSEGRTTDLCLEGDGRLERGDGGLCAVEIDGEREALRGPC